MKRHVKKDLFLKNLIKLAIIILFLLSLYRLGLFIIPRINIYTNPYYTESYYKTLENLFNHSQYRQKKSSAVIPDETVYSYAAGAYLRGIDPILINSERTPLGKYFIAISIFFLKNDQFIVIPFGTLTLISIWLLSLEILKNKLFATIPVSILLFEQLFINQFKTVPLLDIIHLPFILLTLYFFIRETKIHAYLLTSLSLGLAMAVKTVYSGILLISVFVVYFLLKKQMKDLIKLLLSLVIAGLILMLSYFRTFQDGYNLVDFFRFQKWILLYDQSKILYPFSIWRLIFLNQWQAWWGNMGILKADDWQITWPIFTGLSVALIILAIFKKIRISQGTMILCLWLLVYGIFLSVGVASSRFLLPFLPITFILGTYFICKIMVQTDTKI